MDETKVEDTKMWFRNARMFYERIMMRYLRKRGWVVFWLDKENRSCSGGGNTCWLKLYNEELTKEKNNDE